MSLLDDILNATKKAALNKATQIKTAIVDTAKQQAKNPKVTDILPKQVTSTPAPVDTNSVLYIGNKPKAPTPKVAPYFVPDASFRSPTQAESQKIQLETLKANPTVGGAFDFMGRVTSDFGDAIGKRLGTDTLDQRVANASSDAEREKIIKDNLSISSLPARILQTVIPGSAKASEAIFKPAAEGIEKVYNFSKKSDEYKTQNFGEGLANLGNAGYETALLLGTLGEGAAAKAGLKEGAGFLAKKGLPFLTSIAKTRTLGGLTNVLPEDVRQYVNPAFDLYNIATSPEKKVAYARTILGNTLVPYATNYVNNLNIPQAAKDSLGLGINVLGDVAAGYAGGSKIFQKSTPKVDPYSEVAGYTSKTPSPVKLQEELPAITKSDKQSRLEQSIGLSKILDPEAIKPTAFGSLFKGARDIKNKVLSPLNNLLVSPQNQTERGLLAGLQKQWGSGRLEDLLTSSSGNVKEQQGLVNKAKTAVQNLPGQLARGTKFVSGGFGDTDARLAIRSQLKGRQSQGAEVVSALQDSLVNDLNNATELLKTNPAYQGMDKKQLQQSILTRIHQELDPELYPANQTPRPLIGPENDFIKKFRYASDLVNQMNGENKLISDANLVKGQGGKYVPRMYNKYEFGEPATSTGGKPGANREGVSTGQFKQREAVDAWKMENAVRDPIHIITTSLRKSFNNDAAINFYKDVAKNAKYVSDVEKPGFSQVKTVAGGKISKEDAVKEMMSMQGLDPKEYTKSEFNDIVKNTPNEQIEAFQNKIYGPLAGKYVRKDILEDIRGKFFNSPNLQGAYNTLKGVAGLPARQFLKATKTALNPATRLGNDVSNITTFANYAGINPVTATAAYAKADLKSPLARLMRKNGLIEEQLSQQDLRDQALKRWDGKDPNVLQKTYQSILDSYGKSDPKMKVAAMQVLLDRGYSFKDAADTVGQFFQDYNRVGTIYDIGSKLPVWGKTFGKFGSEQARITKNAYITKPIRTIGTNALLGAAATLASQASGETEDEKKLRESRLGTAKIAGSDLSNQAINAVSHLFGGSDVLDPGGVPLSVMTPWGEVNAARLSGQQALNSESGSPGFLGTVGQWSPLSTQAGSDVFYGPIVRSAAGAYNALSGNPNNFSKYFEQDFRGKSPRDPDMNSFQSDSYLLADRQLQNILRDAAVSYSPEIANNVYNMERAIEGKSDIYGRSKNIGDNLLNLIGVKKQQFTPIDYKNLKDQQEQRNDSEEAARLNFNIKLAIKDQVESGYLDKDAIDQRMNDALARRVEPTQEQLQKRKETLLKNADARQVISDDYVYSLVKKSNYGGAMKDVGKTVIGQMIDSGAKNPSSRAELKKLIITYADEIAATYEPNEDGKNPNADKFYKSVTADLKKYWK